MRIGWSSWGFAVLLLAGCYDWRAEVRRAASLDHGCPVERVQVLEDNGNRATRIAALEVCGRRRVYRDVNTSGENVVWVDSTGVILDDLTYAGARTDGTAVVGAGMETSGDEGVSAEAEAIVRAHLDARAGALLACTLGAELTVEAGWGPGASAVSFSPSGVDDPSIASCVISAAGTLAPPSAAHGHVVHPVAAGH